jgi:nucleolar protein 4
MPPKRYFDAATDDGAAPGPSAAGAAAKAPAPATTIFVSRLPFTATSVDLETLFSDIGPLKRAFVVTDPATKASKGVGYVTFAAPDDAARALREMQGKSLDGGSRKMALSWADEKPSLKERKGKKADAADGTAAAPAKRPRLAAPASAGTHSSAGPSKDPDAVRTLILSGLAACTPAANDKTIYKRCRKIGDVERVVHPAHDPSNMSGNAKPSPDIAHVVFRTPNHAATAVDKLHAHIFKGAMLSAVLKKRADGAARLEARMRPEKREKLEAAQAKARAVAEAEAKAAGRALTFTEVKGGVNQVSRLILRNLPFDVSPQSRACSARLLTLCCSDHARRPARRLPALWSHSQHRRAAKGSATNALADPRAEARRGQCERGRELRRRCSRGVYRCCCRGGLERRREL